MRKTRGAQSPSSLKSVAERSFQPRERKAEESTQDPNHKESAMATDTQNRTRTEEFKLDGGKVLDKIKELIHEGNIRRIILKNEEGKTLIEIPLTLGLVGAALLPVFAAVGALAAVATRMVIVVEKVDPD
jgi:hypothetical protein